MNIDVPLSRLNTLLVECLVFPELKRFNHVDSRSLSTYTSAPQPG
jgi:hypothetical protein